MTPARSPIFINPIHRASTPVSPNDISNAVAADVKEAPMILLQMEKSPKKTVLPNATMKARRKNAIQM